MTADALIAARFEISQTLYRYSWSFDFAFAEGIGACFTDDVVGDFGLSTTYGLQEMVAELKRRRTENYGSDEFTMHVNTNTLFSELTDDHGAATTYCLFLVKQTGARDWERRSTGYYDDQFARIDGQWLIKRRQWMFGTRL
jgi:SnoaL-like protein